MKIWIVVFALLLFIGFFYNGCVFASENKKVSAYRFPLKIEKIKDLSNLIPIQPIEIYGLDRRPVLILLPESFFIMISFSLETEN